MAKERSAGATGHRALHGRAATRALATLFVAASTAVALPAGTAEAKPKPSLSEAKAKLTKLNSQVDKLDDKYNKLKEDWKAAKAKLSALNKSVAKEKTTYEGLRQRVVQMASSAYKNGDNTSGSIPALVSAQNPQQVLDQMSVFTQLSRSRATEVNQFLNAAQVLQRQQAQAQQAYNDLNAKKKALDDQEKKLKKAVAQAQSLVNKLGGSAPGSTGGSYTGPASGPARKALQYAYAQLGKPYVYGGTGPNGYDCSGLVMMSWKAAGVSLPRVVPDQHRATHAVSRADLQPGDIVFFDGDNHDGLYVGGGKFIHAPHTGDHVRIASLSGYYTSVFNGGGRP